jgi:hypothetical protein
MRFKNAWNYDSAARQVDTGDFDFILDQGTDVGKAFFDVIEEAINLGMVDFIETFQEENNLLTVEQADTLYELVGAVLAHVGEVDPHEQYATAEELAEAIGDIDLSAFYTKVEADELFEIIGAAAAAVSAHLIASNPHPEYLTEAEGDAAYEPLGGGGGAVSTHVGLSDPHTQYQLESEKAANNGYAPLNSSGDVPLTHLPDHTHVDSSSGGAIAVFPTRTSVTVTTASLASGASETGTITLAAGYRLLNLDVDGAARVQLYESGAARTADADRPNGTDPSQDTAHGVVFEYVSRVAIDTMLAPAVDGRCPTGSTVYYRITNRSGSTRAVEVILSWIRTE